MGTLRYRNSKLNDDVAHRFPYICPTYICVLALGGYRGICTSRDTLLPQQACANAFVSMIFAQWDYYLDSNW